MTETIVTRGMRTSTGASFYYTIDGLGSTILLTDSTQTKAATYSYDSWGNTTSSGAQAATNPWTYAGGYNDTTNNRVKMGARYYNPYRGRFTQTDPSGQEANRYTYVQCNPINATDTAGTYTSADCSNLHKFSNGVAAYGGVASVIGTITAETGVGAFILGTGLGSLAVAGVINSVLDFVC